MCNRSIAPQRNKMGRWKNSFPDMEKFFPCQIERFFPLDIIPLDYRETYVLLLIEGKTPRKGQIYPCGGTCGEWCFVSYPGNICPDMSKSPEILGDDGFEI